MFVFVPAGFSDHYGRYFTIEKSNFEVAKPKVAIYVLTGVRQGVAVAKPSAAALSKVSKPNVDCSCLRGSAETGDGLHRGTLSYHIFSPIHYFLKGVHFHFLQAFPPSPLIALIKSPFLGEILLLKCKLP